MNKPARTQHEAVNQAHLLATRRYSKEKFWYARSEGCR